MRNMCAVVKAGKESEGFLLFCSVPSLGTEQLESDHGGKTRSEMKQENSFLMQLGTTLVSFCSVASLFLTRGTHQSTENSQCQTGPLPRARCQTRACWMADVSASGQQFPRYGFIFATFVLFCSIAPILLKYTLLSLCFS